MSSLPSDLSHQPSLEEPDVSAYQSDLPSSTQTVSVAEAEACHEMIQKEICYIFQYRGEQGGTGGNWGELGGTYGTKET